eukprot:374863-Pelagomonas_calceolata.AAC.1
MELYFLLIQRECTQVVVLEDRVDISHVRQIEVSKGDTKKRKAYASQKAACIKEREMYVWSKGK